MIRAETVSPEQQLIEDIAGFTHDPLGCAMYSFPWGGGDLDGVEGPREWQSDTLITIGDHLQSPETRHQPLKIAVASGHGIGKSALIGMVTHWGMSTCEDCRVVITANTEGQLRTKTGPEVGKWFRMAINADWFSNTATVISAKDKDHAKTWRADFTPWSETNTEAFAGLHNKGKRLILIFDEGSAIADKVWEVAEGALTDEDTEIIWLVFGNPTRATGRFRECFRKHRHRWITRQIDSRDVEGTNKQELQKLVDDHGEDSDRVKVRVRGIFPALSFKQFISADDVDLATDRPLRPEQYNFAPVILGCDPAWSGDDDLVIYLRQGLYSKCLAVLPKNDNDIEVANKLAQFEDEHGADAVFVDAGYGTGIVSAGRTVGRNWELVWFAGKAADPGCLNKRAEIWRDMRDWLKSGGCIEKDTALYDDLTGPETVPRVDGKIQLESKEDMKKRGLPSPNKGDALALTFARHVTRKSRVLPGQAGPRVESDWNPYE